MVIVKVMFMSYALLVEFQASFCGTGTLDLMLVHTSEVNASANARDVQALEANARNRGEGGCGASH